MAKVVKSTIQIIQENLETSLKLAKEEYSVNPSNPLSSIIVDLGLTIIEIKKIK